MLITKPKANVVD